MSVVCYSALLQHISRPLLPRTTLQTTQAGATVVRHVYTSLCADPALHLKAPTLTPGTATLLIKHNEPMQVASSHRLFTPAAAPRVKVVPVGS